VGRRLTRERHGARPAFQGGADALRVGDDGLLAAPLQLVDDRLDLSASSHAGHRQLPSVNDDPFGKALPSADYLCG
jgi:hypothetical protein